MGPGEDDSASGNSASNRASDYTQTLAARMLQSYKALVVKTRKFLSSHFRRLLSVILGPLSFSSSTNSHRSQTTKTVSRSSSGVSQRCRILKSLSSPFSIIVPTRSNALTVIIKSSEILPRRKQSIRCHTGDKAQHNLSRNRPFRGQFSCFSSIGIVKYCQT